MKNYKVINATYDDIIQGGEANERWHLNTAFVTTCLALSAPLQAHMDLIRVAPQTVPRDHSTTSVHPTYNFLLATIIIAWPTGTARYR